MRFWGIDVLDNCEGTTFLQSLIITACLNYWVPGEEILNRLEKPVMLNVTQEKLSLLKQAAYQQARELGHEVNKLVFKLFDKDNYFLAYFHPKREERPRTDGDLIVILDENGKAQCFFQGE